MECLIWNKKGHIKEDFSKNNNNNNNNKKKKSSTSESTIIETGGEEEIVDGELLNWGNLNLNDFEDEYSD